MGTKTSKKDFELFKKECRKWADILSLKDYEWAFFHGVSDEGNRAEYFVNVPVTHLTKKSNTPI